MSNVTISNTYNMTGYTVSTSTGFLDVTSTATIAGTGISAAAGVNIDNSGTIRATDESDGIVLRQGGIVSNYKSGQIYGDFGIESYGPNKLFNYGTITAFGDAVDFEGAGFVSNFGTISGGGQGILLVSGFVDNYGTVFGQVDIGSAGARITNGREGDTVALITGGWGATVLQGIVSNFGTIAGQSDGAVVGIGAGANAAASLITNGAADDQTAVISGETGIVLDLGTIDNFGSIVGTKGDGLDLEGDVTVASGMVGDATVVIQGLTGIAASGALTLANYGLVRGRMGDGITASAGGTVTNGAINDRTVVIEGYSGIVMQGATGTVTNFGTIIGQGPAASPGVDLIAGGLVTNGSGADPGARIAGVIGIDLGAPGTVGNYGTVDGATGDGVILRKGGRVTNGTVVDRTALIEGSSGVVIQGAAGALYNLATIRSTGLLNSPAVDLASGGKVVNGSGADSDARIIGVNGVELGAKGTVSNFGTIDGETGYGVLLKKGGTVINGSAQNHSALIDAYVGVQLNAGGSIENFGTIVSGSVYGQQAVDLAGGAGLTNGSALDTTALITGYFGLQIAGGGTATNFARILGTGDHGAGATLATAAHLVNGSAQIRTAVIEGTTGVTLGADTTLTNFGSIVGLAGTAVHMAAATDLLIDEAGSTFHGKVLGGGGTLELAGAAGTLTGLGTSFTGFGLVTVAAGASWTVAGATTLNSGSTLADDGALRLTGAVTGAGTLALGGKATLTITSTVATGAKLVFTAASETLLLTDPAGFKATLTGFATGDTIDLRSFAAGATVHFSENAADTQGTLKVTDGASSLSVTLFGQYVAAGFALAADGHGGSLVHYTPPGPSAASLALAHS